VVKGQATEIIDIAHFLPLAFDDWLQRKDINGSGQAKPRHLLFVDDSAFFRNMLTPVLTAAGYRVTCANGGAEALDLLGRGRRFDVIVSDIEMPGMDGFQLAQALLAEPLAAGIPILALSSLTGSSVVQRARQAGFSEYVAKFDRQGLIAALQHFAPGYRNAA